MKSSSSEIEQSKLNKQRIKHEHALLNSSMKYSEEIVNLRKSFISKETSCNLMALNQDVITSNHVDLRGNIENFIGMTQVPTGVIGPLKIQGTQANGSFYVPLATTEGALVASYNRGAKVITSSGGANSICLLEKVQRAPTFKLENLNSVLAFVQWVLNLKETFDQLVAQKSNFAKLLDIKTNIEGNHVTLIFEYHTGDAAGQNMVTICTDSIINYIVTKSPVTIIQHYLESNFSGDKKATARSLADARGKRVTAEVKIPEKTLLKQLGVSVNQMIDFWTASVLGTAQSGALGLEGHFANGLTALYMACGQDVACVAEGYVGFTRFEAMLGDLYACVTLPALTVGTVGGGTHLPTQRACLELMDCYGSGKAVKFAEICAAVLLSGELSISAALASGKFSKAHKLFGRKK